MSRMFESSRHLSRPAKGLGAFAVLCALTSVGLGAVSAHLPVFAQGVPDSFATAQQMMQFHALAMLVALLWTTKSPRHVGGVVAAILFALGIVLFSLNIELRLLLDWQLARPLVPWGGTAFLLGWMAMLWTVVSA